MLTQLKIKKQTTFNIVIIKGSLQVGVTGFEPATTWSQTRCATGLRYAPKGFAKLASFAESLKILEEIFSRKYFRTSFPV